MAGEPILVARNCAIVIVEEPLARNPHLRRERPEWSMALQLANAIGAPLLDMRQDGEFLIGEDLLERFGVLDRRSLILMGAFLEGAVTQVALSMLLEGYDIYVCADQVMAADGAREALFLERIRSCAGHVVTMRQILLELLSQERNDKKREPLAALLDVGVSS